MGHSKPSGKISSAAKGKCSSLCRSNTWHAYAWAPTCTHMHTHRHIHTDSLQMFLSYWPKLPWNKAKRKESNSQGDNIFRKKNKALDKNISKYAYLDLHKTFCEVSNEIFRNPNSKRMYFNIQKEYSKLSLRLQIENWKTHQKTDIQIYKRNCLPYLEVLRSTIK